MSGSIAHYRLALQLEPGYPGGLAQLRIPECYVKFHLAAGRQEDAAGEGANCRWERAERVGSTKVKSTRVVSTRVVSTRVGPTRVWLTRVGLTRVGPTSVGPTRLASTRAGSTTRAN